MEESKRSQAAYYSRSLSVPESQIVVGGCLTPIRALCSGIIALSAAEFGDHVLSVNDVIHKVIVYANLESPNALCLRVRDGDKIARIDICFSGHGADESVTSPLVKVARSV